MLALKLALRSVLRRGWSLLLVIVPAALLFAMVTFLIATQATVRQLLEPGIARRAFRIGSIMGLPPESTWLTESQVRQLGRIPGVAMGPGVFRRCYVEEADPNELNCGATNRTYVQIWEMDMPVPEAELDSWDKLKNGAIVTRAAADRHHWKVGDHIQLGFGVEERKGKPLELVVTYIADKYIDPTTVYIHDYYLFARYQVDHIYWVTWVLVDDPANRQAVMDDVDKQLNEANKAHLIWSMESSKQAILGGSQVLREVFNGAGLMSLVLVICVTVGLLILSIEQRTVELAALLAIGFRRGVLARSVLLEGTLLQLPAACLGAFAVWLPFHNNPIMFDIIFRVKVTWQDAAVAIAIGGLIGLIGAIIPAVRVARLDVLTSLR